MYIVPVEDVLGPGADIGRHTHGPDNEELYVIVSGKGFMVLDGEEFEVGPGDVILNRPGGTHGLKNIADAKWRKRRGIGRRSLSIQRNEIVDGLSPTPLLLVLLRDALANAR